MVLDNWAKAQRAKDRDEKISNIKNMEREINEFRQTREQQLQQQMQRMRDGILKKITDVVMERVKSSNLDLVFDKSGPSLNGFSPVLFFERTGRLHGRCNRGTKQRLRRQSFDTAARRHSKNIVI